jgi:quaternary ammonium compound-resistance protein SugE
MAWLYLISAGIFEIGWPIGLKIAQEAQTRVLGICIALFFLAISGFLVWMAQKTIPMGSAYAVWTGIGAAGTFAVGAIVFGDPAGPARVSGVLLIVAGVVTLKLAS